MYLANRIKKWIISKIYKYTCFAYLWLATCLVIDVVTTNNKWDNRPVYLQKIRMNEGNLFEFPACKKAQAPADTHSTTQSDGVGLHMVDENMLKLSVL